MILRWQLVLWFGLVLLLAACASATPEALSITGTPSRPAPPTTAPTVVQQPTLPAEPTIEPTIGPLPTPALLVEERQVELEWPPRMRLGDSDVVRLSLVPSQEGYTVTTEFPDHATVTGTVPVARPGGFDLAAVARLDATGFVFTPEGEQPRGLPLDEPVTWRWSLTPRVPGQHRLAVTLTLRWTPSSGTTGPVRESQVYSRSLEVRVISFLGLTQTQATATGLVGLVFGSGLGLLALRSHALRRPRQGLRAVLPNLALVIEPHPAVQLSSAERGLMQACFRRYARLVVESEFHSGYSGARTFLALPIRADGRADAHTIVKIGERGAIQQEFENYEQFVKDTLPPMTARIQELPVRTASLPSRLRSDTEWSLAALRYTFLAEPGRRPISLRAALLERPDPEYLVKLFETFGPSWWMQRRPYTFRAAQEYDRMLPAHYVLEPTSGRGATLDGRTPPFEANLENGSRVIVRHFPHAERRADGRSRPLRGVGAPGQPPLRVRWMSLDPPEGLTGRVVGTRASLLREFVSGLDRHGLPDPLVRLPALLNENVMGTQSVIHGDLNLENVLVGPGDLVWLIDFAQTREGHPLYDLAHMGAELIAQVIAVQITSVAHYLAVLQLDFPQVPLLSGLHALAGRCLFNASQPREYHLALYFACLGALKFRNLQQFPRHLLYLTAAYLAQSL